MNSFLYFPKKQKKRNKVNKQKENWLIDWFNEQNDPKCLICETSLLVSTRGRTLAVWPLMEKPDEGLRQIYGVWSLAWWASTALKSSDRRIVVPMIHFFKHVEKIRLWNSSSCIIVFLMIWSSERWNHFSVFPTDRMGSRKSLCCGFSALEVTLGVIFVVMTGVCISLVVLYVTRETHAGEKLLDKTSDVHAVMYSELCRLCSDSVFGGRTSLVLVVRLSVSSLASSVFKIKCKNFVWW